jgi:hypothetical protein
VRVRWQRRRSSSNILLVKSYSKLCRSRRGTTPTCLPVPMLALITSMGQYNTHRDGHSHQQVKQSIDRSIHELRMAPSQCLARGNCSSNIYSSTMHFLHHKQLAVAGFAFRSLGYGRPTTTPPWPNLRWNSRALRPLLRRTMANTASSRRTTATAVTYASVILLPMQLLLYDSSRSNAATTTMAEIIYDGS